MSGFTALNVEPEEDIPDEIDDTKEIQIEEAFKLYQNALKLHSQGSEYYPAAEQAYQELFASEVFKYPEVISNFAHEQLDETVTVSGPIIEEVVPVPPTATADSAANSLPQLIYLAYKNRAQFVLDVAHSNLQHDLRDEKLVNKYYYSFCMKSFEDCANALERDDTDLDLWKKAARISDTLYSQRLVRFCLESVLAGDDDDDDGAVDLSGLDEAFASGELDKVLALIQDDLSRSEAGSVRPKTQLMSLLQRSNDPYPFLPPKPKQLEYFDDKQKPSTFANGQLIIYPADRTLESLGSSLLKAFQEVVDGDLNSGAAGCVRIEFSDNQEPIPSNVVIESTSPSDEKADILPELVTVAEPVAVTEEESPKSPASFHSAKDEMINNDEGTRDENLPQESVEGGPKTLKESEITGKEVPQVQIEIRLPTRKRSSTAAGIEEPESRTKSKRLRARESLLELTAQEDDAVQDLDQYNQELLRIIENADETAFSYLNRLLAKVTPTTFGQLSDLRSNFWDDDTATTYSERASLDPHDARLLADMKQIVGQWTDEKSAAIAASPNARETGERLSGLTLFLQHLKPGPAKESESASITRELAILSKLLQSVGASSMSLVELLCEWIFTVLCSQEQSGSDESSYMFDHWSSGFKQKVVEIITISDQELYDMFRNANGCFETRQEVQQLASVKSRFSVGQMKQATQTIFEIYLDVYTALGSPERSATEDEKANELAKLDRWAKLATDLMQVQPTCIEMKDRYQSLDIRHLWAWTKYIGQTSNDDKSHVLACLQDLKALLQQHQIATIKLPNNIAMPEISVAAIDQEISRLNTLDFFMSVFDSDNSDAVDIIMRLEPILEQGSTIETDGEDIHALPETSDRVAELRAFLDSGDASLKLFLWRRLQNAYTSISYTPKVVSCLLRALEIVVAEFYSDRYTQLEPENRQLTMLRSIREADEIVSKTISRLTEDSRAFEILDESHFQSSITAVIALLRLMYGFVLYDDSVRVGKTAAPTLRPSSLKNYEKSRDRLRDAYVRLLTLLFYLLKEATIQFPKEFERPADELAEYLRNVHNALGPRQYCKQCNKLFVKLVKNELLALQSDIDYSQDIAQILYDMYQLKFSPGVGDADHGCIPELLRDKTTAMTLVPLIMTYARRVNPKDLIKSDLKTTIEKIQQCLGNVKTSPGLSYNKKSLSAYLKSPIDPQQVYQSVRGIGDLMTKPVQGDYAKIAATGWYMLLGQMSLAKFKSIKRVNPTSTDDLDTAGTFLRHDLEHNINNWQGWYRLAQVFDAKIEDNLIWNSTKLNESRAEIAILERSAINSYAMAMAIAMRAADDTQESVQQLSDMFCDFALRLYGSSRPPLNMEAFSTEKHMRHLSIDRAMSKAPFVHPFTEYAVWKFAATLLQRRYKPNAKEWLCHYALGKCLWKMLQSPDNSKSRNPVTVDDVLDAFIDAVEAAPTSQKSNDYILEPHYKLVSVIHKLVHKKMLDPRKGVEYLKTTQFSKGAQISEDEQGQLEWEPFILDILKKLGHADKSNWHHRITARAAHVAYDDEPNIVGALGAKHQFTQQIFTKTMTMQVWKPENERPGRHYVYTGRYLVFFVHLLDQLNDRANMEQLVRRIRRKTTDFLDHSKIWERTALTYINMLRRAAKVAEGKERALFDKINYEDFTRISEKLEQWTHSGDVTSIYLDVIHDAIELKKLNNSLMKGSAIDDLIGDTYACMYESFVAQLPPEEVTAPKPTLPQGTFINMTTESVPTGDDRVDRMRLNNLLSAQIDGTNSGISSVISTPAAIGVQTPPRATTPLDPVRIPTPTRPGRTKTITKREVQRKAEAALNRQAMAKTPTLGKKPFIDIPSRGGSNTVAGQALDGKAEETEQDNQQEDVHVESGQPSVLDSTRPSEEPDEKLNGHEENEHEPDDDSELSELDDEEIEKQSMSLLSSNRQRKRKAEDDDGDAGEEDDHEEVDDEGQDGDEEDNDGEDEDNGDDDSEQADAEAEDNEEEDVMEVDDTDQDNVVEIQDSQEPNPFGDE